MSTILHFKDGSTLTDKEVYPHEISEEQLANITSVERVVAGWHLTILKSESIKSFFIITEAFQNMVLRTGTQGPPPKISLRVLGCYLEDSDPPVKILLGMDPRTKQVVLEGIHVKNFRPDGFARALVNPPKLRKNVTREMKISKSGENGESVQWTIMNEPPIRRVYRTENGMGCLIGVNKNKRVKAELRMQGMNCHLIIEPE